MSGSQVCATITNKHCPLCGLQITSCTAGVLSMDDDRPESMPAHECEKCDVCKESCPESAFDCCFEIVWGEGSRSQG